MIRFQSTRWLLAFFVTFALVATACGGPERTDATATTNSEPEVAESEAQPETTGQEPETSEDETETTEPAAADPCEGVTLEATETGVSADTITVVAMADVGSPLAPGLFQGAWDGVNAWADYVNANGGLACRQIEVIEADSMLNAVETTNGFLRACESALALVGTTVLFGSDVNDLNSCPDAAGNPTGVPDIAYIASEPGHGCSANSFHISRPGGACPYDGGPRDHVSSTGFVQWVQENINPELTGIYVVPGDLPSTIAITQPHVEAAAVQGVNLLSSPAISGRSTQAEYGPYIQQLSEGGANYVYNGSNDAAMIAIRKEAAAQGLDPDTITWGCSLSCYTPDFIEQGGSDVEGTYVWMPWLPFFEAEYNDELAAFMDYIDSDFPPAWAAGAWSGGQLFAQVVNDIVAADGPNAVTRAAVLDGLHNTTSFDTNGWWGEADFTTTNTVSPCMVILQVQNGEYVRVHPEEPGTIACGPEQVVATNVDPANFDG